MTSEAAVAARPSHDGTDEGAKRRQIMDGARAVFLAQGFDAASMGEIARAAGVSKGTLYGYPFKKTTQIPTNIWDPTGTNKDCSFIILAEMNETMILDSMSLELAVSRERHTRPVGPLRRTGAGAETRPATAARLYW